jgi:hypothetical protein
MTPPGRQPCVPWSRVLLVARGRLRATSFQKLRGPFVVTPAAQPGVGSSPSIPSRLFHTARLLNRFPHPTLRPASSHIPRIPWPGGASRRHGAEGTGNIRSKRDHAARCRSPRAKSGKDWHRQRGQPVRFTLVCLSASCRVLLRWPIVCPSSSSFF